MKNNLFILVILVISINFRVYTQSVDEKNVPEAVVKSLNDRFKLTGTADWEKENGDYNAEFYVGDYKGNATFKEDGAFVKSEIQVALTTVPDVIKGYLADNFKGLVIDYARKYEFADKKGDYYYVTAPKTIKGKKYIPEFSIDLRGKLVTENVPAELEPYRLKPVEKKETAKETKETKETKATKKETTKTKKEENPTAKEKGTGKTSKKETKKGGEEDESSVKVPQAAKDHFNKTYKMATKTKWKEAETGYEAEYVLKDTKNFAYYTKEGAFEKNQIYVDPNNLPPPVEKAIVDNYNGYKVVSVFNTLTADKQKYYDIKLNKEKGKEDQITTIYLNQAGQVIKEILPEGEEKPDENSVAVADVPAEVKKTFNSKFLKATEVKWTKTDTAYTASCFFKGSKIEAYFDGTGKLKETVRNLGFAKFPPQVQTFITNNYRKENIISGQYIESSESVKKAKYYLIKINVETGKGKSKLTRVKAIKVSPLGKMIEEEFEE